MNFKNIWAFAKAEVRLTKRLFRYWFFVCLAYLLGIALHLYKTVLYDVGSSVSASNAFSNPHFNMTESGIIYLFVFVAGITFLAFDIRARDERERMLEVLDSRPYSNLDLIFGRFLGLFLTTWDPVIRFIVVLQLLGWILPMMGSPIGNTIDPMFLLTFPVFIALPAMALSCAIVFLITLLVRQSFIAIILSLGVLVGQFIIASGALPYSISSVIDLTGFYQLDMHSSDWIVRMAADGAGYLQRLAILSLSVGLLFLAALLHPRRESGVRQKLTLGAGGATGLALVLFIGVYQMRMGTDNQIEAWHQAHLKAAPQQGQLNGISGTVAIDPSEGLEAKVTLKVATAGQSNALFTLNPGFTLTAVTDKAGNELKHQFDNGLLQVELAGGSDTQTSEIVVSYNGKPDNRFGYLDSAINYRQMTTRETRVKQLGVDNGYFDDSYVALMPGIHWLPTLGSDVARDTRVKDFFAVDLSVTAPQGWTVAGPGKRQVSGAQVRFAPKGQISEVALMAAPFERFSRQIRGIEFELLVHPERIDNIKVLAQGEQAIVDYVQSQLDLAKDAGLNYPFDAFTLIEVPNNLRGYAGGWRMQTTLSPPSMLLLKEAGLPSSRFDYDPVARWGIGRPQLEQENGQALVMRDRLIDFFTNDLTGANLFDAFARSTFAHRTAAKGDDREALDYVLHQLATLVLSDHQSYFSAARFADVTDRLPNETLQRDKKASSLSDRVLERIFNFRSVWEMTRKTRFDQINPTAEPKFTLDVLALKGGNIAQVLYDSLGAKKSGQLLAALLNDYQGQSFTRADLVAATRDQDPELAGAINFLFSEAGYAGFTADKVTVERIDGDSKERFQLSVVVQNQELTTGFARVAWTEKANGEKTFSQPILLTPNKAMEFGAVLTAVPAEVYIEPYLSLNRGAFVAKRFKASEVVGGDIVPFNGVRPVDSNGPQQLKEIIVDDLDPQFAVYFENKNGERIVEKDKEGSAEAILNYARRNVPLEWRLRNLPSAWGKYRHTIAYTRAGEGKSKASMSTVIPDKGKWALKVHYPRLDFIPKDRGGTWQLEVFNNNTSQVVSFDANKAEIGWNLVTELELAPGDVRVEFSDKTDGAVVIADAISWAPVKKL